MHNLERGHTSICKKQLLMFNTLLFEIFSLVCLVVKSDNSGDSHFFEDGDVIIWSKYTILS